MMKFAVLIMILMASGISRGDTEHDVNISENPSIMLKQEKSPEMSIAFDGQIYINGKKIERMSDPEIKTELKKIVAVLQESSMTDYLFRQTEMLLEEIGRLQEELRKCNADVLFGTDMDVSVSVSDPNVEDTNE